jgi:outer membrane protein assembly factor BamA
LGYSEDYVRGWKNVAFEGEHGIKLFNEIRIPVIKPRYLTGKELPLLKNIDLINKLYLKYGLYFTIFYDMGTVWDKGTTISKLHFIKGTGIGLNVILPFDYIVRIEWATRIKKPLVGQLGFSLSAKF